MAPNCMLCTGKGRFNIQGVRKGYCMACAKAKGMLKSGDYDPTEPEGFTEFWKTLNQGVYESWAETV